MSIFTLQDICNIEKGKQIDTSTLDGLLPYRYINGGIKESGFYKDYNIDGETILISEGGASCGYISYIDEKIWHGCHCYALTNFKVLPKYLFYALKANQERIMALRTGAAMPNIKKTTLQNMQLSLHDDINVQTNIITVLDNIDMQITNRTRQLEKLDILVKSRFIEMFGDPVVNPYGYPKVTLSELADIKIGPFGSLLHKDEYIEDGHPLINPSHIIDEKICPDRKLTISISKYQELAPYHLIKNDVVLGRRGEMGRCAVVNEDNLLCGTGSLFIRSKGGVTADYIQKIISFPTFKSSIEDLAVGQTMLNLNVPIVSNFQIILAPIEVQESYYSFITQVDKSKFEIKQSLEKLEIQKKALMQEYFG